MDKETKHSHNAHTAETRDKTALSAEEVREHIEGAGNLKWVKMEDLLEASPESCVDGRGRESIVGTPGGNAGEFILALTSAEEISGQKILLERMDEILGRYLEKTGKFYMHTDDHALIKAGLTEDGVRKGAIEDDERKEKLLEILSNPANGGCGHLRLMAQNPSEYDVRPELVAEVIRAIYRALWEGKDIEFVVLEGGHNEGAVVNIMLDGEEVRAETKIPTISPSVKGVQVFVNHPQATSFMRQEILGHMAKITGLELDLDKFEKQIREIGNKQLTATIGYLAEGLPIYTAHFKNGKLDKVE